MSLARGALCALLLGLVGLPLSFQGLEATSYGGWPAIGFAIALLLVAGPTWFWQVVAAEAVMIAVAVMHSYDVSFLSGVLASVGILLPALYAQRGLTKTGSGRIRLDEIDSGRYHLVTAGAALICGVLAMAATAPLYDAEDVLLAGLMSFLAALTAQLAVLPLLIQGSALPAAGGALEVMAQRFALLLSVVLVFGPTTRLGVVFVIFPMLGWAANRATRREAHWQLFLVCVTTYLLTLSGRGPLAGDLRGVPESLTPAMIYLLMAAACYMTVPLTMTVERLVAMTSQATRDASTVERLLGAVTGALIIATDAEGRITHFNTGAEDTLGYSPEEVIGRAQACSTPPRRSPGRPRTSGCDRGTTGSSWRWSVAASAATGSSCARTANGGWQR